MCNKYHYRSLKSWSRAGSTGCPLQNPMGRHFAGASAVALAVLVLTVSLLAVYNSQFGYPSHSRKNRKISSILRDLVEEVNEVETIGLQYKKLLIIDPFAELVQAQVMPLHDRMSSLKRQIRTYEDMERSTAPTNFMEASFREINLIDDELNHFESQYGAILAATKKELARLRRELKDAYRKLSRTIDDETLEILQESNIYLDVGVDHPAQEIKISPNKTLDEVIELIEQVTDLFAEWEIGFDEVRQTYGTTPVFSLMKFLTNCRKRIDEFLEVNGGYIRLTFMLLEIQLEERRSDEGRIVAVQNGFKRRYDRLTEMLSDDVLSTRERVKNLRFLSKKSEL